MKHLKWYQRFKSIQSSMVFAFVFLITFIVITSSTISLIFARQSARDSAVAYTEQIIEQISNNIEYYVREMDNVARGLTFSLDVIEYFEGDTDIGTKNRVKLQMEKLLTGREDIIAASLFGYNQDVISYQDKELNPYVNITDSKWYKGAVVFSGKPYVTASYVQNIYQGSYPWVVSMSSEFKNLEGDKSLGVLVIDMNYKIINDICNKVTLGDKGYVYIIDGNGAIVWHPSQKLINTGIYDEVVEDMILLDDGNYEFTQNDEQKIYTMTTSSLTGWRIIGVTYEDELVKNQSRMALLFIGVAAISILVSFVISSVIAATLSKPIKKLRKSMVKVQGGNLEEVVEIENNNEIGELSHTFNAMTRDIRSLIEANNKEQKLKRQSELKALQAQINPHFLYNTLDSIIWMSMADKKEEVVEMTSSLAKLFRLSINRGKEMIPIADEVSHVEHYLTIQKYRYSDKLTYSIELDDKLRHVTTLKLLLQPVVENAIYHGLKYKEGGGHIALNIYQENEQVVMKINDNGVGMTPEQLDNIFETKESSKGSGVGVLNVYERLKLYYGDEAGMTYNSTLGIGTTVTIYFPVRMEVTGDEA